MGSEETNRLAPVQKPQGKTLANDKVLTTQVM